MFALSYCICSCMSTFYFRLYRSTMYINMAKICSCWCCLNVFCVLKRGQVISLKIGFCIHDNACTAWTIKLYLTWMIGWFDPMRHVRVPLKEIFSMHTVWLWKSSTLNPLKVRGSFKIFPESLYFREIQNSTTI